MIEISRDNKIFGAAVLAEVSAAASTIQRALGLDADSPLLDHLPSQREWSRMQTGLRLQKIGQWLSAECYRLCDINDNPAHFVEVEDPLYAVGTRD